MGIANSLSAGWTVAGVGDFAGSGNSGIKITNGQQVAIWEMDGAGIHDASVNAGTLAAGWHLLA